MSLEFHTIAMFLVRLHPGLVLAPVDRHRGVGEDVGDLPLHRGSAAAGCVSGENPVGHDLRVDEARVARLHREEARGELANRVGDDICGEAHLRNPGLIPSSGT
jgi:hypothetical protein